MCSSVLFACRNNWNSSQLHVHLIALGFLVWVFNRGSKIGILLIMQFNFFSLEWASSLTKAPNFFNQYLVGQPLFYSCGWVLHKWLSFFFVKDLACVPQKFLLIKTNFFFFLFSVDKSSESRKYKRFVGYLDVAGHDWQRTHDSTCITNSGPDVVCIPPASVY